MDQSTHPAHVRDPRVAVQATGRRRRAVGEQRAREDPLVDRGLQSMALGRPPVAVVNQLGVARHELVFHMRYFSIQRDGFDRAMRSQQNAASWRLVAAAGFHPHVAVLDNIGATNAVSPASLIELRQYLRSAQHLSVDRHHVAVLKGQNQLLRLIGCRFRAHRPAPHVFLGRDPGVFKHIALIGNMQQVGVHGVRGFLLCLGKIHGDIVLLTICLLYTSPSPRD